MVSHEAFKNTQRWYMFGTVLRFRRGAADDDNNQPRSMSSSSPEHPRRSMILHKF
jgi:hypothetical protein